MNLIHTIDPDGIPNLDDMETDDLRNFASRHTSGRNAAELFDSTGREATAATNDLANYAWNKLTARNCRYDGYIETAQNYERICQNIYNNLPTWARW